MRPAHPQVDGVNRVARRHDPDIAQGDFDLTASRPDFLRDEPKCLLGDRFGLLNPGSGRGTKAQLKLSRVHLRENFRSQPRDDERDDGTGEKEVGWHEQPPQRDRSAEQLAVHSRSNGVGLTRVLAAQQPDAEYRDERAGQDVACDHREADGKRQREEQSSGRSLHHERRDEHRQDAEHREQPGHRRLSHSPPRSKGHRWRLFHLNMDILDRDR